MVAKKKKPKKCSQTKYFLESIVFNKRYEMCTNTNKLLNLLTTGSFTVLSFSQCNMSPSNSYSREQK